MMNLGHIRNFAEAGAVFAYSLSGGKDSMAAAYEASRLLDAWGHDPALRVAIHADLGRAEWRETPALVEACAARLGVPLMVVRHNKHDMVSRWEARFEAGLARYADLSVFNLIGPWSSAALRFCTAEMKQQVISPALLRAFPGRDIVSVVGIRREESPARALAPEAKPEPRWARKGSTMTTWHPVVDWTARDVFGLHENEKLPLHPGYTRWGVSRISCAFCIMQSQPDQAAAVRHPGNHDLYRYLVGLEVRSTFSFQQARWLADLGAPLLRPDVAAAVAGAKARAVERRELEAALPAGLRYVKGWPVRLPTLDEAEAVVAARRVILGHHGLEDRFGRPGLVIDRFAELIGAQRDRAVAA